MIHQIKQCLQAVKLLILTALVLLTFVYVYPAYAQGPVVNTAVDENDTSCGDGDCSLRDAIIVANPGETITFSGDYSIYLNSQLSIDKVLTIDGGNNIIVVSGDTNNDNSPNTRVFLVGSSGVVTLSNLSVVSGTVQGAGLRNDSGIVTINNSTFAGHIATGLYNNAGTAVINNSTFSGNKNTTAAGLHNNAGTVTINDSIFSNNESTSIGGGLINQDSGAVIISNSTFLENDSGSGDGGAIYNFNSGVVTITNSSIFSANKGISGAGLYNTAGTVIINHSTFSGNQSTVTGGALLNRNSGTINISHSTFSGNTAGTRGGVLNHLENSAVTVDHSTFSGNSSNQDGGGFYIASGAATINNSTFSGNRATSSNGGGLYLVSTAVVTINNSTLSGNEAGNAGGGVYNLSGGLHLHNTIIANSIGPDCSLGVSPIATNDTNLIEDGTCGPALSGDPNLGPLQNNGGDTRTHALLGGSPAINAGNNATCLSTDQRGYLRSDGSCDIGAFESFNVYIPIVIK